MKKGLSFVISLSFIMLGAIFLSACAQSASNEARVQDVDQEVFMNKMKEPNTILLDVRTTDEYTQGHIPNSQQIDLTSADFNEKVGKLDKSKTYLVYCAGGTRSAKAANIMINQKFDKVYNLLGGFSHWNGPKE